MMKVTSTPVKDSTEIYEEVREQICLLQYPPGEMISENALASEYEVSRSVMRLIMWRLEQDGLVHIRKGSAATVTAVDIKSLRDVYVVRQKLIELVGELRPARITEDIIDNLESIEDQTRQMREQYDPVALAKLYYAFHLEMLKTIRNSFLKDITEKLYHRTARVWLQLLPDLDWIEEVDVMSEEIHDVTEALRKGDMVTIAQVRHRHMKMLLQRINSYLVDELVNQ
jgi:DNA-binding GntR family transcriptional regulator